MKYSIRDCIVFTRNRTGSWLTLSLYPYVYYYNALELLWFSNLSIFENLNVIIFKYVPGITLSEALLKYLRWISIPNNPFKKSQIQIHSCFNPI